MEREIGGFLFAWSLILVLKLHPLWLVLGNMEGWLFYALLLVLRKNVGMHVCTVYDLKKIVGIALCAPENLPLKTLSFCDALHSLRSNLNDPNNVLQSWDPTLVNPCTWFHVTCNNDNSVIRVDLGNAALSGQLVPQLGQLKNLQYLELYSNNISGPIPSELGNLTNLVSLDLYLNSFTGRIPDTLGKLSKLRFLDLSNNHLSGAVPDNGSFSLFTPISFANNLDLCGPVTGHPCPGSPPFSPPPPFVPPPPVSTPAEEDPEVHLGQLKRFSLRELQVATDSFSNKNILGRGGFGKVYKGRLADGSLVAVKRLKEERTPGGELQFQTEVEMISMAVHRNLLRLRGFCMTPTERLLSCLFSCFTRLWNNDLFIYLMQWMLSQVKGLLKEKKLEMLVDPDLQNKYVGAEVEQLIQVALLCTQGTPTERPKMSEVVRMLEGDGLAERWDEWQKVEVLRQEVELAPHPNSDWIVDSTENLHAVELSGPR
ncbi:hypothetical protein SADUNF_Sadunf19G0096000 [Salix dunnii]|uniref:Protein kinase domain-containing protein n=1 Tax=Salix dunnii TaxID=1413687 RepID=A0A835MCT9_9ROSI|nr:hypothetical protein SADUNF_Sadunf19G0096000 [Salix dunnii]